MVIKTRVSHWILQTFDPRASILDPYHHRRHVRYDMALLGSLLVRCYLFFPHHIIISSPEPKRLHPMLSRESEGEQRRRRRRRMMITITSKPKERERNERERIVHVCITAMHASFIHSFSLYSRHRLIKPRVNKTCRLIRPVFPGHFTVYITYAT